jgi:hypothetical protein
MATEATGKTGQKVSTEKRMQAFAKTITDGASADYMKYLKQEAKENRIIEKHL